MHSYPSQQILPHKGKELSFLPLKCTTVLPCKSFPTWGRSQTVLPEIHVQSYGEGVKISLFPPPCTAILPTNPNSPHGEGVKLSSPCNAKLSFSANSSPHWEESSFLLPKCKAILPNKFFLFYVGKNSSP